MHSHAAVSCQETPMLDRWIPTLAFFAALGSGLIAGVFFAFSTFVMRALAKLPAPSGMSAMQSINVVVINPMFLGVFVGTAGLGVVAAVIAVVRWQRMGAGWLLAGGLLYVIGTFIVTMLCNVPLNDALAKISANDPNAAERWTSYVSRWTLWNHVRTAAALAATGSFIFACKG